MTRWPGGPLASKGSRRLLQRLAALPGLKRGGSSRGWGLSAAHRVQAPGGFPKLSDGVDVTIPSWRFFFLHQAVDEGNGSSGSRSSRRFQQWPRCAKGSQRIAELVRRAIPQDSRPGPPADPAGAYCRGQKQRAFGQAVAPPPGDRTLRLGGQGSWGCFHPQGLPCSSRSLTQGPA